MKAVNCEEFKQWVLVRRDIGHEGYADLLESRPPCRELVLQHPLLEFFAIDGPVVFDTEFALEKIDLPLSCRRRDPVDHGVRKSNVRLDPFRQGRVGQGGRADDGIGGDNPVMRDVVARHHRERHDALIFTRLQAGNDQAEDSLRLIRILSICRNCRMSRVELAGSVDEISTFRNRQRYDPGGRIRKLGRDHLRITDRQDVDHRPGHPCRRLVVVLFDDGRQEVLRGKLFAHDRIGRQDAGPDDRPIMILALVEQVVEIYGLMRPVEVADAEVDDTRCERRSLIGRDGSRLCDLGKRCQR